MVVLSYHLYCQHRQMIFFQDCFRHIFHHEPCIVGMGKLGCYPLFNSGGYPRSLVWGFSSSYVCGLLRWIQKAGKKSFATAHFIGANSLRLIYKPTSKAIAAEVANSWQHRAQLHRHYCSDCCRGGKLLAALCSATRPLL